MYKKKINMKKMFMYVYKKVLKYLIWKNMKKKITAKGCGEEEGGGIRMNAINWLQLS